MKRLLILSALLLSPALSSGLAQTATPAATPIVPVPSVVVAVIGGKNISLEQFEKQFRITAGRVLNGQGQPYSVEGAASLNGYRGEILTQYVNQQALLMEALQKGVTVADTDVDGQYNQTVSQFPTPEALSAALKQSGINGGEELKALIRESVITQKYLESQTGRFSYSDTVLRGYYNANAAKYKKAGQSCVKHILVATADEAKAAKARLDAGEDFAKVAGEVSTDPGSKEQGGDLGCFAQGETVPEFDAASFTGPLGSLQQVKTQFGVHLLVVNSRNAATTAPFETAKAEIQKTLSQGAANRYLQGAAKRLKVTVYAERVAKATPAPAVPVPEVAPAPK
ncbi:MAG: peptidylprolyl isomerase [Pseudopedobacter sp.]|nr:peptidylprolyl isomerase [Deinococcales bacterium]